MDNPHYVTPEQADKKYCPIAMNSGTVLYCAGPKCMAWRWRLMRYADDKDPDTDAWPAIYSTTHGFCGMVRI